MPKPAVNIKVLELLGDKELLAVLEDMRGSSARRIMRRAIDTGLTPIAKEARQRAPGAEKHRLKRMIGKKSHTTKTGNIVGYVYVKEHGSDKITVEGRIVDFSVAASFLEFGTPQIKATRFIRGAGEAKGWEAMRIVRENANKGLDAEWRRLNKRGKSAFL